MTHTNYFYEIEKFLSLQQQHKMDFPLDFPHLRKLENSLENSQPITKGFSDDFFPHFKPQQQDPLQAILLELKEQSQLLLEIKVLLQNKN